MTLSDELLLRLAKDAFDVLNWARRIGMKQEQQLREVAEAFKKTLQESQ